MVITPHIVVQGAERAADFYRDAFGAKELSRIPTPDGRLMSVQLRLGDSVLHLADEFPELGALAPPTIGGTPVVLALDADDPAAVFARRSRQGRGFVSRCRRRSGTTCTGNSTTPSVIAGVSASIYATCPTRRS